jgi:lysophospholipase L1-like esterase
MVRTVLSSIVLMSTGFALRVGCIGDSITAGTCSWATHGYPAVLQRLLGEGFQVKNFGSSGKTLMRHGGPGNASYWSQSTWTAALAFNADIYVVLLGTNDAKLVNAMWVSQNYTRDYIAMVAALKALPSRPWVFLATSPPLYPANPYPMNVTVVNVLLPRLVADLAAALSTDSETRAASGRLAVIDLFSIMGGVHQKRPDLFCDGVHPNDAGYIAIANAVYSAITAAAGLQQIWPAFSPASEEQVRDAEPRPEWNPLHPELFLHRPSVYQSFPLQLRQRFEKQRLEKWLRYIEGQRRHAKQLE